MIDWLVMHGNDPVWKPKNSIFVLLREIFSPKSTHYELIAISAVYFNGRSLANNLIVSNASIFCKDNRILCL